MGAVPLRDVLDIANRADEIADALAGELHVISQDVDVQHIGATSVRRGHTKGDVDIAVRVPDSAFASVVSTLRGRFAVAQPLNWTLTYASFSDDRWDLLVGLQVCVMGSRDDFLVATRDLLRREPDIADAYDAVKRSAASKGSDAYWRAKDKFLNDLCDAQDLRPQSSL